MGGKKERDPSLARTYLDRLVPEEGEDRELRRALAARARRDLTRLLRRPELKGLQPTASALGRGAGSDPAWSDGRVRGWIGQAQTAVAQLRAVESRASRSRLVDLLTETGDLRRAAPSGALPREFEARVARIATARLAALARTFPDPESVADRSPVPEVVGRGRRSFEPRVSRAMALLHLAWPAAASLVAARTHTVIPVDEPGVVSYSSAGEPGTTYVNAHSSPLVRLAEDLLHEAVHQRLHEIEALHRLFRHAGEDAPRFYSPWRREWRPVRGVLHALHTFTAGALHFEAVLRACDRGDLRMHDGRRCWLARRLLEEVHMVASTLAALRRAGPEYLLTAEGVRLLEVVSRESKGMTPAVRRRRAWLSTSGRGRSELRRAERLALRLRSEPLRWDWEAGKGRV